MKLRTEEYTFANGAKISITEENWDIGTALQEEQRKAESARSEDPRLQFFRAKIWPVLFAPSSGSVPTLIEAFAMVDNAPADLNGWYELIQVVNPQWFTNTEHRKDLKVTFSDGSSVVVHDGNVPSVMMKLNDLEQAALSREYDNLNKSVFAVTFYAKFAACSTGDLPNEEDARTMPSPELDKWYKGVKEVNPLWFESILQAQSEAAEKLKAAEIKKKPNRKPKK